MKFVLFYHSLVSDWNHGNAHFLRGVVSELLARGHHVDVYEPANGWSRGRLIATHGEAPLRQFACRFPLLRSRLYDLDRLDVDAALDDADVAIVHEWNSPVLLERLGAYRRRAPSLRLLFHDTHHRSVTAPEEMAQFDLRDVDGVLAFGGAIRQRYLDEGWSAHAWTWHEAADTRVFHPYPELPHQGDLIWIGNWGDDERTAELKEFLVEPVHALRLMARVHGVRYPAEALAMLSHAGIDYRGWLPNFRVPEVFARHRVTVHVPRRPYVRALPGIPTIRVFEALACGIPLVSAPWDDSENLFRTGQDYLVAEDGADMQRKLHDVLNDPELARSLGESGLETIRARHTCAHRVDELLHIIDDLHPSLPAWQRVAAQASVVMGAAR